MKKRVHSALFWGFITVSSLVMYPIAVTIWLATVAFDRRLVALHRFTCFWASLYTWCNPAWPVTIDGREKIQPGTTYVMVANHLSLIDILVGVGLCVRRSFVPACLAAIALCFAYLLAGTILTPTLWADPLGPFVKVAPAAALSLALIAMAEER